jgi:5-methylcytosine-specific restriction endonuclease McrA
MARSEFTSKTKELAYERSEGNCEECGQPFAGRRPEYDHGLPDYLGGDNSLENCRCICPKCHKTKTLEEDRPRIDKTRRLIKKQSGVRSRGWWKPEGYKHKWGSR